MLTRLQEVPPSAINIRASPQGWWNGQVLAVCSERLVRVAFERDCVWAMEPHTPPLSGCLHNYADLYRALCFQSTDNFVESDAWLASISGYVSKLWTYQRTNVMAPNEQTPTTWVRIFALRDRSALLAQVVIVPWLWHWRWLWSHQPAAETSHVHLLCIVLCLT
jgi:hypothetical protein